MFFSLGPLIRLTSQDLKPHCVAKLRGQQAQPSLSAPYSQSWGYTHA